MPMRLPYLKTSRVRLQERKNTCLRAQYTNADQHVRHFLDIVASDPVLSPILAALQGLITLHFQSVESQIDSQRCTLILPDTERMRAAFYMRLLQLYADPDPKVGIPGFNNLFARGSNKYQDKTDEFFQQILLPLYIYLDETIDHGDMTLYLLARYRRECAWFTQNELATRYENADSRKKEESVDAHLREWLFRSGVDYPFSTPNSPSGRADVVVWQNEIPIPLEVKVFDGVNRDAKHVSQGLWQAFRYATDYSSSFGYLVVYNATQSQLRFDGALPQSASGTVVPVGDKIVFPIVVAVLPPESSASKEKPSLSVTIPLPEPMV